MPSGFALAYILLLAMILAVGYRWVGPKPVIVHPFVTASTGAVQPQSKRQTLPGPFSVIRGLAANSPYRHSLSPNRPRPYLSVSS